MHLRVHTPTSHVFSRRCWLLPPPRPKKHLAGFPWWALMGWTDGEAAFLCRSVVSHALSLACLVLFLLSFSRQMRQYSVAAIQTTIVAPELSSYTEPLLLARVLLRVRADMSVTFLLPPLPKSLSLPICAALAQPGLCNCPRLFPPCSPSLTRRIERCLHLGCDVLNGTKVQIA